MLHETNVTDLRTDVVATDRDVHGSTYLVTRAWSSASADAARRSVQRSGFHPTDQALLADQDVELPAEATDPGALARLLLLETRAPSEPGYEREDLLKAMRLMQRVLQNRLASPARYVARGATSEQVIVRMGKQFAGFRDYPTLLASKVDRLLEAVRTGHAATRTFVLDAITVATEPASIPARRQISAWRTVRRGSPGPGFQFLLSLQGNDFYSTAPVPPLAGHHRQSGPFQTHGSTHRN